MGDGLELSGGEKKEELTKVLGDWALLDSIEQNKFPSKMRRPKYELTQDGDSSYAWFSDCIELDVRSVDASRRKLVSQLGHSKKTYADDAVTLSDFAKARMGRKRVDGKLTVRICLYLCRMPRDLLHKRLMDRHLEIDSASREDMRYDLSLEDIAAAAMTLDGTGRFENFWLSPALWIESRGGGRWDPDCYEREMLDDRESIKNHCGGEPLDPDDVKWVIDEILNKHARLDSLCDDIEQYDRANRVSAKLGTPTGFHSRIYSCAVEVEAKAVETERDAADDSPLAKSFYAKDLEAVGAEVGKASSLKSLKNGSLSTVVSNLEGGFRTPLDESVDVLEDDERAAFLRKWLGFDAMPLGRWPSKYSPALMQQVAVSLAAGRPFPANDIVSVNGPPGTGKTTLLKDVIAANIVEKAHVLAKTEEPDNAFEKIQLDRRGGYLRYAPSMYRLKPEYDAVNDFGIIVCSSNNKAVENISKELPDGGRFLDGVPEGEKEAFRGSDDGDKSLFELAWSKKEPARRDLYFSYAATCQFAEDEPEEGVGSKDPLDLLISARLGKWGNIKSFSRYSLAKVIYASDSKESKEHLRAYKKARKLFIEQYRKVREAMASRQEIAVNCEKYASLMSEREKAAARLEEAKARISAYSREQIEQVRYLAIKAGCSSAELPTSADEMKSLKIKLEKDARAERAIAEAEREYRESLDALESASFFKRGKAKSRVAAARQRLDDCGGEYRESILLSLNGDGKKSLLDALRDYDKREIELQIDEERAKNAVEKVDNQIAVLKTFGFDKIERFDFDALASGINSDDIEERRKWQLENPAPAPDDSLSRGRDILFLRALQMTREFVLASKAIRFNMKNLRAVWGEEEIPVDGVEGKERIKFISKDLRKVMPALFQTLNIITPVISTTFASVQRMFADVPIEASGKAPFGLLIIDEAGQAAPQAAVGALARCRRAMVVGDPSQVAPVVTSELDFPRREMAKDLKGKFFLSKEASVQHFADARNPYGTNRKTADGEGAFWVGCPLIIHRRCVSPMFDISNEVSYGGLMINETRDLDEHDPRLERFYWPSSQWFDVRGKEQGGGNHFVEKQAVRALEIVANAFEKLGAKEGRAPSLFVISPFKSVANGFRNYLKKRSGGGSLEFCEGGESVSVDEEAWKSFLEDNIGTVHAFQGKEADEVVFLLGCDTSCEGTVKWVSPNIVNVAASRAKYRLYVIGDAAAWKANESVATMRRILATAWIAHYKEWERNPDSEKGNRELELARRMLPCGESFPGFDEIDADNGGFPADDDATFDLIIKNLGESPERILTDEVFQRFGFSDENDFEKAFRECDEDGINRVTESLRTGMFLCTVFSASGEAQAGFDLSFCGICFCRAFERYLQTICLPLLKEIPSVPEEFKRKDSPSIGQYEKPLKKASACLAHCCDAAFEDKDKGKRNPLTADMWSKFGSGVGQAGRMRNSIAHGGKKTELTSVELNRGIVAWTLFPKGFTEKGKRGFPASEEKGLMRSRAAFAAVRYAIDNGLVKGEDLERFNGEPGFDSESEERLLS